jgi:hypothetical protein
MSLLPAQSLWLSRDTFPEHHQRRAMSTIIGRSKYPPDAPNSKTNLDFWKECNHFYKLACKTLSTVHVTDSYENISIFTCRLSAGLRAKQQFNLSPRDALVLLEAKPRDLNATRGTVEVTRSPTQRVDTYRLSTQQVNSRSHRVTNSRPTCIRVVFSVLRQLCGSGQGYDGFPSRTAGAIISGTHIRLGCESMAQPMQTLKRDLVLSCRRP